MKNRILSALLAVLLVLVMLPITTVSAGTVEAVDSTPDSVGWTEIKDANGFKAITTGGNYYLSDDIDFSEGGNPIEVSYIVEKFGFGIIDGRGHTLSGFKLTANGTENNVGVFGQLGHNNNATEGITVIRNLKIGSETAKIEANVSGAQTAFGFIAAQDYVNSDKVGRICIENVNVYGNCTITGATKAWAGGFIGVCHDVTLTNCVFDGELIVTGDAAATDIHVGGFVGSIPNTAGAETGSLFENCDNKASLSATNGAYIGGVIGYLGCKQNLPQNEW